ncbi:MAG: DUF86 domain-containing protein [Thermodesulforhabdaceae bacterium]|jgi:uncharacterized protein with HEPN domain
MRKFEILGEATKNIPDWMREKYSQILWKRVVGTIDRLVHSYFSIDYKLIWHTIKIEIPKPKPEL